MVPVGPLVEVDVGDGVELDAEARFPDPDGPGRGQRPGARPAGRRHQPQQHLGQLGDRGRRGRHPGRRRSRRRAPHAGLGHQPLGPHARDRAHPLRPAVRHPHRRAPARPGPTLARRRPGRADVRHLRHWQHVRPAAPHRRAAGALKYQEPSTPRPRPASRARCPTNSATWSRRPCSTRRCGTACTAPPRPRRNLARAPRWLRRSAPAAYGSHTRTDRRRRPGCERTQPPPTDPTSRTPAVGLLPHQLLGGHVCVVGGRTPGALSPMRHSCGAAICRCMFERR